MTVRYDEMVVVVGLAVKLAVRSVMFSDEHYNLPTLYMFITI